MLTKRDLLSIGLIIDERLEEKLDAILDKKLKYLPTKDNFYKKMSEVMGELKTIREEHTISAYKSSDHEDRLEKLEKIHPSFQHL